MIKPSRVSRLLALFGDQTIALFVCYGGALAVSLWAGAGTAGAASIALGPAIAIGMLARSGRFMTSRDALAIAAAHAGISTAFGIGPAHWAAALAGDLIASAVGAAIFCASRRTKLVGSQPALAAVACATGIVAALAGSLTRLAAAPDWSAIITALPAAWGSAALSIALGAMVVLTYGRPAAETGGLENPEATPKTIEFFISSAATLALALAAVFDNRPISMLAASLALLWFALRYDVFQASAAAFAFSTFLLALGHQGSWRGLAGWPFSPVGDFSQNVAVALLTLPSVFVAAVMSDQRRQKMIYAYEATHDGLTRLANRTRYRQVLDRALKSATVTGQRFVLMLIDLDHFKAVNDNYGHAAGDQLLVEVSERLRRSVRASDLVARLGGDEFAVVAAISSVNDAMTMAKRLVEAVNQPCELSGVVFEPSITLGGALAPDSGFDRETLLRFADEALYEAKRAGRNTWRFSAGDRLAAQDVIWVDGPPSVEFEGETVLID
ncbi:diguanylate cyclase domain-containing protein [Hansschlegelia quercus]|uniref:GGDEF domain-containing protein n=1 Tax=Hansschlegelia quercus TaxID=2528245 RepID=A0A4Q9GSZ8_9HYPH|nr:GGDEF domain-containing protein [Hansschlegelia quercus]TBN54927.1 GGDEF domain-containing protein [Hansschlegelia quercus]